jgi:hypothetical protein
MRQVKLWMLAAILIICGMSWMTSCTDNTDNPSGGADYRTTLFVATDRHEVGKGNNLTAMLARAVAGSGIRPQTMLLGGDYVGGMSDMTPIFSIRDIYDEVYAIVDPLNTRVMMTYGSHDNNCTEGYDAFYSGPRRSDGYYTYGISYAQMVYDTDSATTAAIRYYQEHPDEQNDSIRPPQPEQGDSLAPPPLGGGAPKQMGYNGIDQADRYGISAESAARSFTQWVAAIADSDPIVVMSHVPLHATRGDNVGAMTWYKALTAAAQTHDVLLLWGHNHTLEEFGDSLDQYSYLLTAGDSIDIQGDSITGVVRCPLNFTYANAGYLKLGRASVITFTDTNGNGHYDMMELRRYSLDADQPDRQFGLTGKPNPYVITFPTRNN